MFAYTHILTVIGLVYWLSYTYILMQVHTRVFSAPYPVVDGMGSIKVKIAMDELSVLLTDQRKDEEGRHTTLVSK